MPYKDRAKRLAWKRAYGRRPQVRDRKRERDRLYRNRPGIRERRRAGASALYRRPEVRKRVLDRQRSERRLWRIVGGPRTFYHVTRSSAVPLILRRGLVPATNELRPAGASVFLWCHLGEAAEMAAFTGMDRILRVRIPRTWAEPDDGYLPIEAVYGHAWRVNRRIPPELIRSV